MVRTVPKGPLALISSTVGLVALVLGLFATAVVDTGYTASASSNNGRYSVGVNLAGAEFGSNVPGEHGTDYIYPTDQQLAYYQDKGVGIIRLPFRWERLQRCLNCALDQGELGRISDVVGMAHARGMQVILDPHNFARYEGKLIGTSAVPNSAFKQFWTKLARHFDGNPGIWAYALMNEPYNTDGRWPAAAQAGIDGIRAADDETMILVPGDGWSGAWSWYIHSAGLNVSDPADNFMYEAHQYFDADSSGRYLKSYDGERAYPNVGVDRVRPFVEWLKARGARGFIGEYGVPGDDPRWLAVMDRFLAYLSENGISSTYWAAGSWWGDYPMSIEPENGQDKPQMDVLEAYLNDGGQSTEDPEDGSPTPTPTPAPPSPPASAPEAGCAVGTFQASYFNSKDLSGSPALERCEPTIDNQWGSGSPDVAVRADHFSARWTGNHDLAAGTYTFTVRADDGIRLLVDDEPLIDGWRDQSPTTYTASTELQAGEHTITVEYYEHTGDATAQVQWEMNASPEPPEPEPPLPPNTPPSANAVVDRTSGTAPLTVQFSSAGSSDSDGDPLAFTWDFGDGATTSAAANPSHTYESAGDYTATLTVSDGNGGSHSDTVSISVEAPAPPDPPAPSACPDGQFVAEYFDNMTLSGAPGVTRCEDAIRHIWWFGGPAGDISRDRFSVRWTLAQEFDAGSYTFQARTDDGVRVFVDGNAVIDSWNDQSGSLNQASVDLAAGEHRVVVEYYEHTGFALAVFDWDFESAEDR